MAATLRTRIARALNAALLARDRAEMRAVDRLISPMTAPPRHPRARRRRREKPRPPAGALEGDGRHAREGVVGVSIGAVPG